jgi:hypothetical protein
VTDEEGIENYGKSHCARAVSHQQEDSVIVCAVSVLYLRRANNRGKILGGLRDIH